MSTDKSFSTDQRVSNDSLPPTNDSQLSLATRSHRIQLKTAMTDLADPQTPTETVLSHFAFLKSFSAGQENHKELLSECGCVETSILWILNKDISIQLAAIRVLRSLSVIRSNQKILCKPQNIVEIIKTLSLDSVKVKLNTAGLLCNVAVLYEGKIIVGKSGAIGPLLELLCCGHAKARHEASGALRNLSFYDDNEKEFVKFDGIRKACNALDDASRPAVRRNCALILSNLISINNENLQIVIECQAVVLLYQALLEIDVCIAPCLQNLIDSLPVASVHPPTTPTQIIYYDELKERIAELQSNSDLDITLHVLQRLLWLSSRRGASEPFVKVWIRELGGIPEITKKLTESNLAILRATLSLLRSLAVEPSNRAIIGSNQTIINLGRCLSVPHKHVLQNAAAVLRNIACVAPINVDIGKLGVCPSLVHLLQTSTSRAVIEEAVGSVRNLTSQPANHQILIQSGVVKAFIHIIQNHPSKSEQQWNCVLAMSNLLHASSARLAAFELLKLGGVEIIQDVLPILHKHLNIGESVLKGVKKHISRVADFLSQTNQKPLKQPDISEYRNACLQLPLDLTVLTVATMKNPNGLLNTTIIYGHVDKDSLKPSDPRTKLSAVTQKKSFEIQTLPLRYHLESKFGKINKTLQLIDERCATHLRVLEQRRQHLSQRQHSKPTVKLSPSKLIGSIGRRRGVKRRLSSLSASCVSDDGDSDNDVKNNSRIDSPNTNNTTTNNNNNTNNINSFNILSERSLSSLRVDYALCDSGAALLASVLLSNISDSNENNANEQEQRVSTPNALIKASLFDVMSLPGANIGDVGLIHLCQVISNKNCKFKLIELQDNPITDVGIYYLCKALRYNQSVRSINLRDLMFVSNQGWHWIGELLKINKFIEKIEIRGLSATDDGLKSVLEGIRVNGSLCQFMFSSNTQVNSSLQVEVVQLLTRNINITWEKMHSIVFEIAFIFASRYIPSYVILEIIDWLPNMHLISHHRKIDLIISITKSIKSIYNQPNRMSIASRVGTRRSSRLKRY